MTLSFPLAAVLILILCFSLSAARADNSIIQNGTFLQKETGWTLSPGEAGVVRIDDYDYIEPPYLLKIEHGSKPTASSASQLLIVYSGTIYTVTCWVKPEVSQLVGDGGAQVVVTDSSGNTVLAASEVLNRTGPWQQVRFTVNTRQHERVAVRLQFKDAAGSARFDDVRVEPGNLVAEKTQPTSDPALVNLALGKPYAWSLPPNHALTNSESDKTDLTDGVRTVGHFWVQKSTVGWQHTRGPVDITVDLGKVEPIRGAAFGTAAGCAGVAYPISIAVSVSEDGKKFHFAGDLARLTEGRMPPAYNNYSTFTYRTRNLQTKGRYVRFTAVPAGVFTCCDEIEVYRGDDALTTRDYSQTTTNEEFILDKTRLTQLGVYRRVRSDLERTENLVKESSMSPAARAEALRELSGVLSDLEKTNFPETHKGFKAVTPVNDLHRRVMAVYARVLADGGTPPLAVWHTPPYRMLDMFEKPIGNVESLRVAMMNNEHRAEAVNVTNASQVSQRVSLAIDGLPGGTNPAYVKVYQVDCVDTREGLPVAAALVELKAEGGRFTAEVPAGMTRQFWLSFEPKDLAPGNHGGQVKLTGEGLSQAVVLELAIAQMRFPDKPDLAFMMCDYVFDKLYNITTENQAAAVKDMLEHNVDTPWCASGTVPFPTAKDFDANGNLTGKINFTAWDAFVKMFPGTRSYGGFATIFANSGFASFAQGTPAFDRAVSQWAAAWAAHNREIGLKPGQAMVLFLDEPAADEDYKASYNFAKAFREGTREFVLLSDPNASFVNSEWGKKAMEVFDIICPTRSHYDLLDAKGKQYIQNMRERGKQIWLYMCSGPVRSYTASYFRLQPWHCAAENAVGSMFWSYGDAGRGDNWNEYWSVGGCGYAPAYLSADSVTTSKHWEATREGIADYQYLKMLRDRVEALDKGGVKSPELDQARALVKSQARGLIDEVYNRWGRNEEGEYGPAALAEAGRLKTLDALCALEKAGK